MRGSTPSGAPANPARVALIQPDTGVRTALPDNDPDPDADVDYWEAQADNAVREVRKYLHPEADAERGANPGGAALGEPAVTAPNAERAALLGQGHDPVSLLWLCVPSDATTWAETVDLLEPLHAYRGLVPHALHSAREAGYPRFWNKADGDHVGYNSASLGRVWLCLCPRFTYYAHVVTATLVPLKTWT